MCQIIVMERKKIEQALHAVLYTGFLVFVGPHNDDAVILAFAFLLLDALGKQISGIIQSPEHKGFFFLAPIGLEQHSESGDDIEAKVLNDKNQCDGSRQQMNERESRHENPVVVELKMDGIDIALQ